MKKLSILFVMAAAAAMFFSSCTKEYDEPTIVWTPNDLSNYVVIGDVDTYNKTLTIDFTAEAGIDNIQIWKYVHKMENVDLATFDVQPTGYEGLTEFNYVLDTDNTESDFAGGVTKIVYEVEVTDASETPQTTTKEYTFFVDEAYALTIKVVDAQGGEITDAAVTFNSVLMNEAPYVFEHIMEGTYEYSVAKTGYTTVTIADFVMPATDTTITVELMPELSAYSENVYISHAATSSYATYNGVRVEDTENTTIGVKYDSNTDTDIIIKTTANCEGWVVVDNDGFTSYSELEAAYTSGTAVMEYALPRDYDSKAYAEKFLISKVDGAYLLVKYVDGFVNPNVHDGNLGNIAVFQYKN